MDQQHQEQQKKKRPHYNNRRRGNGNANPEAAESHAQNNTAAAPAGNNKRPQNAPRSEGHGEARNGGKGRGGDIHTRRGGFHPAPDAPAEERKQTASEGARESKENRPTSENRENNRGGNRSRGGRGHAYDGHQNDNRQKNSPPRDSKQNDARAAEGAKDHRSTDAHSGESKNSDNRNRARNDRGRGRRNEGRNNAEDTIVSRESAPVLKDPEMDSWFTPTVGDTRNTSLFSDKPSVAIEPEALPHIELDLNDILPAIVLEKYESEQPTADTATNEEADSEATEEEPVPTVEVVGVRFNKTGKVYYFDPNGITARRGDAVIVETARGLEFGEAWQPNHTVSESEIVPPLRPVIRLADEKDVAHNADNRKREDEAFRICLDKIRVHGLDMKLVEAQYTFDNSKLLFYFTSAGRVDFRELVKDLASVFRTRIELRQIGIRDEAKLMGGLGICGRPLCCASFLSDFSQVSIKMAKEQNLSLNSAKISGTCGRLMCCLNYEYPVYCEATRHTPPVGSTVATPDGNGTVTESNPLAGTVKVTLFNAPAGTLPQYYRSADVRQLHDGKTQPAESNPGEELEEIKED